jgi:hypothetical protein
MSFILSFVNFTQLSPTETVCEAYVYELPEFFRRRLAGLLRTITFSRRLMLDNVNNIRLNFLCLTKWTAACHWSNTTNVMLQLGPLHTYFYLNKIYHNPIEFWLIHLGKQLTSDSLLECDPNPLGNFNVYPYEFCSETQNS